MFCHYKTSKINSLNELKHYINLNNFDEKYTCDDNSISFQGLGGSRSVLN